MNVLLDRNGWMDGWMVGMSKRHQTKPSCSTDGCTGRGNGRKIKSVSGCKNVPAEEKTGEIDGWMGVERCGGRTLQWLHLTAE